MKVRIKKFVELTEPIEVLVDEEVDVCLEDVMAGFFASARAREDETRANSLSKWTVSGELNGLLDGVTKLLSLIPDEYIRALPPVMLQHHRRRLLAQSLRYQSPESEAVTEQ